jgi:hypothetical protein
MWDVGSLWYEYWLIIYHVTEMIPKLPFIGPAVLILMCCALRGRWRSPPQARCAPCGVGGGAASSRRSCSMTRRRTTSSSPLVLGGGLRGMCGVVLGVRAVCGSNRGLFRTRGIPGVAVQHFHSDVVRSGNTRCVRMFRSQRRHPTIGVNSV